MIIWSSGKIYRRKRVDGGKNGSGDVLLATTARYNVLVGLVHFRLNRSHSIGPAYQPTHDTLALARIARTDLINV